MESWTSFPDQNEERVIVEIIDSKTIRLDRPLNYTHWGQGLARAEVGMLTRQIVFQSDASSVSTEFGGHIMLRVLEQCEVSGIEVTRMGQTGHMGRYSFHFHVLGEKSFQSSKRFFIKGKLFTCNM